MISCRIRLRWWRTSALLGSSAYGRPSASATRRSSDFEVVALSIDRAGAGVVRKFYDEIGIKHLKLVIDPTMRVMRDLRVVGLPMTFLVGPSGKEIGRLIGPAEWDTAEMVAFFKSQIAQTKQ